MSDQELIILYQLPEVHMYMQIHTTSTHTTDYRLRIDYLAALIITQVQLTCSSNISIHWSLVLHMAELVLGAVWTAALDAGVATTTLTTHASSCK
jgi:hypothetical protein